jgi:hypothetical protein
MADDQLQSIVDELATRLTRSVAIDDAGIRLLAVSRAPGSNPSASTASTVESP